MGIKKNQELITYDINIDLKQSLDFTVHATNLKEAKRIAFLRFVKELKPGQTQMQSEVLGLKEA